MSGWRSVERLSAGPAPGQLPQLCRCHGPARPWSERGRRGQRPGEDEPARGHRLQRRWLFARPEARIALDGSTGERGVAIGYAPGQKKRITVDGVPASSLTNYAAGGAGARVVTF